MHLIGHEAYNFDGQGWLTLDNIFHKTRANSQVWCHRPFPTYGLVPASNPASPAHTVRSAIITPNLCQSHPGDPTKGGRTEIYGSNFVHKGKHPALYSTPPEYTRFPRLEFSSGDQGSAVWTIQEVLNDPQLNLIQARTVRWLSCEKAVRNLRQCLPSLLMSLEREATIRHDAQVHSLVLFVKNFLFVVSIPPVQHSLARVRTFNKTAIGFYQFFPSYTSCSRNQGIEKLTTQDDEIFFKLL